MQTDLADTSIAVNLTRLVEAAKGAGGAGWFGIELCGALSTAGAGAVTVLTVPANHDYITRMVRSRGFDKIALQRIDSDLEHWLNGAGHSLFDVYIDPLNGLEPRLLPAHMASVAVIHDLMFRRDPYVFSQGEIDFRCVHYGAAIARADLVLTVSEREATDIRTLFPGKEVRVVAQPAYFVSGKNLLPKPSNRPILLFSPGVQWNHKNHFRLVSAFLDILEKNRISPATKLCLSSILPIEANHQLLKPLIEASAHSEAVIQIPYLDRERFASFMERVDCLVLPSIHEGYGIPLIEAVASGKPVLTANFPSLASLKEVPDSVRLIDEPKDMAVMANALAAFLNDLPDASPRPELCPDLDDFATQVATMVRDASKARRSRPKIRVQRRIGQDRRLRKCTAYVFGQPSQERLIALAAAGIGCKIFGAANVQDGARIACSSSDPARLALHLAHEILLSEDRFILVSSADQIELIDPADIVLAHDRLLAAQSAARVRMSDLVDGAAGLVAADRGLPPFGLYDLNSLDLPFEATLHDILSRMEHATTLYSPTARRAMILDPSLKNANGHHLAVASGLARSLRLNGYATVVCCNHRNTLHSIEGADTVVASLSDYLYEQNADIGLVLYEFEKQFADAGIGSGDLVFAFCATPAMLAALTLWLISLPAYGRPQIVIRFDRPEWRTPPATIGYAEAFALIRSFALRQNFSFSVESEGLQRCFAESAGEEFPIRFNHVAAVENPLEVILPEMASQNEAVVVAYVGEARQEKGFQHLPRIFDLVLPQLTDVNIRLRIQCGSNVWNQTPEINAAKARLEALAANDRRIELLEGALPDDQYLELIRDADLLFLPYEPPQYRIRGSGVATEAIAYGTEIVVSHGLDIASTYAGSNVSESESFSVESLADCLLARIRARAAQPRRRHDTCRSVSPLANLADFATSFIEDHSARCAEPVKFALWIGNDTQGEGSETVYTSQLEYLRARGYFVLQLFAPYPSRWRLEAPWKFDASKFVCDGEVVLNFRSGAAIEAVMDGLQCGNDDVATLFGTAWTLTEIPKLIAKIIKSTPPSLAIVNYAHHRPLVDQFAPQGIPCVVETHDIQALQYAIQQSRAIDTAELKREMVLVSTYDHIVSISRSEAEIFAEHCGSDKVTWCMPFVDAPTIAPSAQWDHDILFVGSSHDANLKSLKWFMDQVYAPYLYPQGLSLAVAGSAGLHLDIARFDGLVTSPGRVPDLAEWYAGAGVVALPINSGAGVPIKVIDAFTRALPFVLTDFPAKAMNLDCAIPLATSAMEFAEQILMCLSSAEERERRSSIGRQFVATTASRDRYFETWDGILASLQGDVR